MIEAIWDAQKNCYLPILSKTSTLEFALYDGHTVLKHNRYRILEPETSLYFPSDQLDLVLMPLVGFDLQGHRLGMGGGYYDRTFKFLQDNTIRKPFMLGLAYELQKMEQIPVDPWDISMDGVLTEEQLYLF
jgi:5-formyltetrahydrofolate cyclo-ligase